MHGNSKEGFAHTNRWDECVPGRVNTHWNIGPETTTGLPDVWVPIIKLGECEVAKFTPNSLACVTRLDEVSRSACVMSIQQKDLDKGHKQSEGT
jgi:hypothetical protein